MSRRRELLVVTVVAAAAVVLAAWPCVREAASTLSDPAAARNPWWGADARLIVWILAWDVHALVTDPLHLFDANIFHPAPEMLAGSEHLLASTLLSGPIYLATRNPLLAANAAALLTYALAAVAVYALLRALELRVAAAALGAAAFPLGPFRVPFELHVLQYPNAVLPLVVLGALAARRGRLLPLAAATAVGAFSSYYTAAMVALVLGVETVVALATDGRRAAFRVLGAALPGFLLLALVSVPYLHHLRDGRQLASPGMQALSDALRLFFQGRLLDPNDPFVGVGWMVWSLVPLGLIAPLFLCRAPDARWWRWVALAALGVVLASGPTLHLGSLAVPLPDRLLLATPLRAVGRFLILAHLGLVGLAAEGAVLLLGTIEAGLHRRAAAVVGALLVAAAPLPRALHLADLPRTPLPTAATLPAVYQRLAAAGAGPLLEMPGPGVAPKRLVWQGDAMYLSTFHWLPLLNGHTGYPPWWWPAVAAEADRLPAPDALQTLVDMTGVEWIYVRHVRTAPRDLAAWAALPARLAGAVTVEAAEDGDLLVHVGLAPRRPWAAALARRHRPPDTSALGTPLAPLPPAEARGRIDVPTAPPALAGGRPFGLPLRVINGGGADWPALLPADASDRDLVVVEATWHATDGGPDAGSERVRLPHDVAAGMDANFMPLLAAPERPGRYTLELALVQVDGTPFDAAATTRLEVEVRAPGARREREARGLEPSPAP
jgi:hypothetical protein